MDTTTDHFTPLALRVRGNDTLCGLTLTIDCYDFIMLIASLIAYEKAYHTKSCLGRIVDNYLLSFRPKAEVSYA